MNTHVHTSTCTSSLFCVQEGYSERDSHDNLSSGETTEKNLNRILRGANVQTKREKNMESKVNEREVEREPGRDSSQVKCLWFSLTSSGRLIALRHHKHFLFQPATPTHVVIQPCSQTTPVSHLPSPSCTRYWVLRSIQIAVHGCQSESIIL